MSTPVNLLGLDADGLARVGSQWGEKPFRARQLSRWIHQRGQDARNILIGHGSKNSMRVGMKAHLLQILRQRCSSVRVVGDIENHSGTSRQNLKAPR